MPFKWGPPRAWAEAASGRFPKLRLTLWYEEEGCDFAGELECISWSPPPHPLPCSTLVQTCPAPSAPPIGLSHVQPSVPPPRGSHVSLLPHPTTITTIATATTSSPGPAADVAGEVVDEDEWEPSARRWLEDIVGCGYLQPGNSDGVVETVLAIYEEQEEGVQLHHLYQRPRSDFEAAINASVDVADVLHDMAWGAGTETQALCAVALVSAVKLVWSPDRHRANFDVIGEGLKIAVRTVLLCAARRCQDDSKLLSHVPPEIWFKIFRSLRAVDYDPWGASDPFACSVSEDTTLRVVLGGAQ